VNKLSQSGELWKKILIPWLSLFHVILSPGYTTQKDLCASGGSDGAWHGGSTLIVVFG
jgi:hypothetical protein